MARTKNTAKAPSSAKAPLTAAQKEKQARARARANERRKRANDPYYGTLMEGELDQRRGEYVREVNIRREKRNEAINKAKAAKRERENKTKLK